MDDTTKPMPEIDFFQRTWRATCVTCGRQIGFSTTRPEALHRITAAGWVLDDLRGWRCPEHQPWTA